MADNNWQTDTLANICDSIDYGFTESAKTLPVGPKFLRITDIVDGHIDWATVPYCEVAEDEMEKYKIHHGDIVIARTGATTGYSIFIKNPPNAVFASYLVRYKVKKEFDGQFVSYFLKSPEYWEYIRGVLGDKSAQPNASASTIAQVKVNYPPLPEQRLIAGTLGALDDKIELNRRMNRTLESMARAVFREMMKNIDEQGSILEFANLLSGGTPSTAEESYWNGNIEWVSAKDVSNANGVFLLDTEKKITQAGIDNSATKLLPAKTVIVTARGTVGAHCMLGKPMTMNQTNYGLKAKEGIGDYFVYFTLSEMVEQLKQQSYGTIFDTITTKTFQNALCAQPSWDVIQKFEEQVTPMMDAILNNQEESRTLASLRDSLLPKLMRGEVRVKPRQEE